MSQPQSALDHEMTNVGPLQDEVWHVGAWLLGMPLLQRSTTASQYLVNVGSLIIIYQPKPNLLLTIDF